MIASGNSKQAQNAASGNSKQNADASQKSAAALSWEEQKKAANERKRLERLVEKLGAQIEEKEAAKEVQAQIAAVDAELDELTAQWEKAAEELG